MQCYEISKGKFLRIPLLVTREELLMLKFNGSISTFKFAFDNFWHYYLPSSYYFGFPRVVYQYKIEVSGAFVHLLPSPVLRSYLIHITR